MLSSELLMRRGLLATQAVTAWSACASCLPSTQSCHYPRRSSRPISASGIAHYKVALQVQPTFWSDAHARSMRLRFMQKLTGLGAGPGANVSYSIYVRLRSTTRAECLKGPTISWKILADGLR